MGLFLGPRLFVVRHSFALAADGGCATTDNGSDFLSFPARPNQFANLLVCFRAEVRVATALWRFPGLGGLLDLVGVAKHSPLDNCRPPPIWRRSARG